MEKKEIRDIVIASAALAVAFSFNRNLQEFFINVPAAIVGVVSGFVLHELAHRFIARRYHCHAEFVLWRNGIILALALAVISNGAFVFAAPGAVYIQNAVDLWGNPVGLSKKRNAIISIAGPATNIALAAAFIGASFLVTSYSSLLLFAASINIWLAVFNMIPLPPLDGSKVFFWDKRVWAVVFVGLAAALILL